MKTNEVVIDAELEKNLPDEAQNLIKSEGFQISRESGVC